MLDSWQNKIVLSLVGCMLEIGLLALILKAKPPENY